MLCFTMGMAANPLFSQAFELGSWSLINVKYNNREKLSFFGEAQLRSLKFYNHFHYYEFKGGLNTKYKRMLQLLQRQGLTKPGDFVLPKNNDELRIWPQITLNQSIGLIRVEQRYRAEFRFTSNGYRNRFRYRLGCSYPFGKERNGYKPFQVNASNELFFTDIQPYFERNRLSFY